jgi:hypothetical protein
MLIPGSLINAKGDHTGNGWGRRTGIVHERRNVSEGSLPGGGLVRIVANRDVCAKPHGRVHGVPQSDTLMKPANSR